MLTLFTFFILAVLFYFLIAFGFYIYHGIKRNRNFSIANSRKNLLVGDYERYYELYATHKSLAENSFKWPVLALISLDTAISMRNPNQKESV